MSETEKSKLRTLRHSRRLTIDALRLRMKEHGIELSRSAVSYHETGERGVRPEVAKAYAAVLGVSVEDLGVGCERAT